MQAKIIPIYGKIAYSGDLGTIFSIDTEAQKWIRTRYHDVPVMKNEYPKIPIINYTKNPHILQESLSCSRERLPENGGDLAEYLKFIHDLGIEIINYDHFVYLNTGVFKCSRCHQVVNGGCGTGYATDENKNKICYACCALDDIEVMKNQNKIILYLNMNTMTVQNWPGSLKINIIHLAKGGHNIAGVRYDVWFNFAGKKWHGIQYGNNSQLCHCNAVKR